MLRIKGAVLFRRGQYCTGILLPPGAVIYRYIIAPPPPRQLCTGTILPPPPAGIRGGSFIPLQSPACGSLHGSDGPVAPYQWSGVSWTNPGLLMQFLHVLRGLFSRCTAVINKYYLECRSEDVYTNSDIV